MLEDYYKYLYRQFKIDYRGHFVDEYEGQNKLDRRANLFAIKNTRIVWESQHGN